MMPMQYTSLSRDRTLPRWLRGNGYIRTWVRVRGIRPWEVGCGQSGDFRGEADLPGWSKLSLNVAPRCRQKGISKFLKRGEAEINRGWVRVWFLRWDCWHFGRFGLWRRKEWEIGNFWGERDYNKSKNKYDTKANARMGIKTMAEVGTASTAGRHWGGFALIQTLGPCHYRYKKSNVWTGVLKLI